MTQNIFRPGYALRRSVLELAPTYSKLLGVSQKYRGRSYDAPRS